MIALDGLSKSHDGGKSFAVRDVSLTVPTGSLLVLLGGSGSGKTTTLKMMNRLVEPSTGRVDEAAGMCGAWTRWNSAAASATSSRASACSRT